MGSDGRLALERVLERVDGAGFGDWKTLRIGGVVNVAVSCRETSYGELV